jgi:transposase-like protein
VSRIKYTDEFRRQALERMKSADNVSALARELGVRRKWLYQWRNEAASGVKRPAVQVRPAEPDPRNKRIEQLLQLVGEQEAKLRFFENALQRVKERQQNNGGDGGSESTTPSGR